MKPFAVLFLFLSLPLFVLFHSGHFVHSSPEDNAADYHPNDSSINVKKHLNKLMSYSAENELKENEILIVNLWATWCAPCIQEVPELNELVADYKDKGVRFLAFSDESAEVFEKFLQKRPEFIFNYEQNFGNKEVGRFIKSMDKQFQGKGIPLHILVKADGTVGQVLVGAAPVYNAMIRGFLDSQI